MRVAGTEQHAIRDDAGATPAGFELFQEQADEQQFGFFGFTDLQQIFGGAVKIERAFEWRIGEDQRVGIALQCVVFAQAVAVLDRRVVDAVQGHVHRADAQHRRIKIGAVEHVVMKMLLQCGIKEQRFVVPFQIFRRRDQITAGAAGRIANDILRRRCGQFHHQLDDMARRAELPILPGAGDLGQHVFVQIALGVAVVHRDGVDHVGDFIQQRRGRDDEHRILHETGVRTPGTAIERFDERKYLIAEYGEFAFRIEILEVRPAQFALLRFKNGVVERFAEQIGLAFLPGVQFVQPLGEQQIGDLLDYRQRIGHAAGPERVPDLIDLILDGTGDHNNSKACLFV